MPVKGLVVCFTYLPGQMSGSSLFYAHLTCWDDHMGTNTAYRVSSELTPDGMSAQIPDGTLSLVAVAALSDETTCCICQQLLKHVEAELDSPVS